MTYDSQISFTLDTICPWTYLGKRRLERALQIVRAKEDLPVTFTVKFLPFQLYPDASQGGEDKYAWYRSSKYGDSDSKMGMYTALMTAYGQAEQPPINYKYGGTIANTIHAHRVIRHFQEDKGPETADRLVASLYRQYFEEERHPSSRETLLKACAEAGIADAEAKEFVEDESEELMDVKNAVREQKGNGVDAVPYVIIEGRKRDYTLEGCKEVEEYVKALELCAKESA